MQLCLQLQVHADCDDEQDTLGTTLFLLTESNVVLCRGCPVEILFLEEPLVVDTQARHCEVYCVYVYIYMGVGVCVWMSICFGVWGRVLCDLFDFFGFDWF